MSASSTPLTISGNAVGTFVPAVRHRLKHLGIELRSHFGSGFCLRDGLTGEILFNEDPAYGDDEYVASLVPGVYKSGHVAALAENDYSLLFAFPIKYDNKSIVAVAPFRLAHAGMVDYAQVAQLLCISESDARSWYAQQIEWTFSSLERLSFVSSGKISSEAEIDRLTEEVDKVSDSLASTYEEISLLYGLTQNLRISSSDNQLGDLALNWLTEVIPSQTLAIIFQQPGDRLDNAGLTASSLTPLMVGDNSIEPDQLTEFIQSQHLSTKATTFVANQRVTERDDWPLSEVRQMIAVPLVEGENIFGWLFALNHKEDKGFGTVEASLLNSVGTILGIHSGNIELYRQQSEFVTSVVRALTSAIDAKDPYTHGHSDRVARLAVRLAQQLGEDDDTLNLMYMAGLLHDVGKIGIEDSVLRKPGRLTDEEYEHIKLHPELGFNILSGLKQLEEVLPVVLHHHEQWDGKGYPHRLAGDSIPKLARITAVADAYDAMSSDRPYRKGMPEERVEKIFREGSGSQWDPEVIKAFFDCRSDIHRIMNDENHSRSFELGSRPE